MPCSPTPPSGRLGGAKLAVKAERTCTSPSLTLPGDGREVSGDYGNPGFTCLLLSVSFFLTSQFQTGGGINNPSAWAQFHAWDLSAPGGRALQAWTLLTACNGVGTAEAGRPAQRETEHTIN